MFKNKPIEIVNDLKILGIIFDKRFTFRKQCISIRKNLAARLNIIKYLTSNKSFINIHTLINVTRALILSKIDYGLPIYGWCANTNLNQINAPYHQAVRRSINAFPTSPVKCVLAEAGLPSIKDRLRDATYKLIPKLVNSQNKILNTEFINAFTHKRNYKKKSTIRRCVSYCEMLQISKHGTKAKTSQKSPWMLESSSYDITLHKNNKNDVNPVIHRKLFHDLSISYKNQNWNMIFTDGSKTEFTTTFAVVHEDGSLIAGGILEPYCSIFTAEATAFKQALDLASHNKGKFAICTDSMSVIEAVKNIYNNNPLLNNIRNFLLRYSKKTKLIWTPSHIGISGNEFADSAARSAGKAAYLNFHTTEPKDLSNYIAHSLAEKKEIEWQQDPHRYVTLNPKGTRATYPRTTPRQQSTIMVRLRIGHSKLTHEHLLTGTPKKPCPFCKGLLSTDHLIHDCKKLKSTRERIFGQVAPSDLLTNITKTNIDIINQFFKELDLSKKI